MLYAAFAIIFFLIAVFAIVIRGSAGLLKQRLEDQPSIAGDIDVEEQDGLLLDVEY